MGNCQGTHEAAVVEHPCGKIEKLFWAVTAHQLMMQNPGHYVAITKSDPTVSLRSKPKPIVKLLPAGAPLRVGTHYRLVNFEEVFMHFAQQSIGSILNGSKGTRQRSSDLIKSRCEEACEGARRRPRKMESSHMQGGSSMAPVFSSCWANHAVCVCEDVGLEKKKKKK
eukprot:c24118_g1_i2 orf=1042-1545(+)